MLKKKRRGAIKSQQLSRLLGMPKNTVMNVCVGEKLKCD